MKLREYQSHAVDFLLPRQRGFIVAPAGSGKTIMAASAAARRAAAFDRVVWLANTREQCEQARAACLRQVWQDPVEIHVACVAARPDITGAAIVIIDEAHHTPAQTWWNTVSGANCVVWGFSATPWSGDWERDGTLKAFFEDAFHVVPREEVQAGGSITPGKVIVHDLDTEGQFDAEIDRLTAQEVIIRARRHPYIPRDEHERRARWQFTAEAMRTNLARNARIVDLANTAAASVLVLVSTIEHGQALEAQIGGALLVHAKLGKKKRAAAIEAFRAGSLRCMIATSLADEGLDVPRAAVLILAAGGRSPGKLEQRAGRVMRPHAGKEIGTVHDFSDRGAGLAANQFKARARTYRKLGYSINAA
jgi:superfamily II DNA or RNA helicase